jgi:hypothetical protein
MDLSNKFNNQDLRRDNARLGHLLKGKLDLNAHIRKNPLTKQLSDHRASALAAIGDTNWMLSGSFPIEGSFARQPAFERHGVKFV